MPSYLSHKELILNIVRILSKISVNTKACLIMASLDSEFIICLSQILTKYKDNMTIMIRAAFILGNITTLSQIHYSI